MAGILDSKSRIFDTVLTTEGRRQLSEGQLRISFASFTDSSTFYEEDIVSGSSDAGNRLFLEAPSSLPKDQITFETDDSGNLIPFLGNRDDFFLSGQRITVSGSVRATSDSSFASLATELIESSVDNFENLMMIGTTDSFLDENGFDVSQNQVRFTITNEFPFDVDQIGDSLVLEDMPSFFEDKRLSHIPNFKYLPPVNKGGSRLGKYPGKSQKDITSFSQIEREIKGRESVQITFPITSTGNNLYSQMFEISNGKMVKLDVIDFGEFTTSDPDHPVKQVFFVGKVFIDSTGNGTFANQFVLIFD